MSIREQLRKALNEIEAARDMQKRLDNPISAVDAYDAALYRIRGDAELWALIEESERVPV